MCFEESDFLVNTDYQYEGKTRVLKTRLIRKRKGNGKYINITLFLSRSAEAQLVEC